MYLGLERDVMVAGRHRQGQTRGWPQLALRVAGAVLLAMSAARYEDVVAGRG